MAEFLGLDDREFARRYVRRVNQGLSLIELSGGNCVFYENGCKIYPVRPAQCRTFPFWKEILERPLNWERAAQECPGMNQGKLHSQQEINDLLRLK